MKICRLCLYKGDDKQISSIFENENQDLASKIQDCVSVIITENDNLPSTACMACIHQIMQWVLFKEKCIKSNKILLNSLAEKDLKVDLCRTYDGDFKSNSCDSDNEDKSKIFNKKQQNESSLYDNNQSDMESDDKIDIFEEFFDYKGDLPENIYSCDICLHVFDNCFDYLDHQEVHDGRNVFKCNKCPELFSTRKELVSHDRNHKGPCPHCGKMVLKSSLKLHLIKHTDRHKCSQCSNCFNSRAALGQHVITVHTNIKNHICETCGKRFSSQTAMRVHKKSHSDERLYPCKMCNYAGRTASAIYVHMSTHANDMCVCDVCSKTFKSTRNLNDHLRRVHRKEKKHECSHCDKKFVDKYMLRVHLRCHTGVRPYQCGLCEKAFIRSDGLREHMMTHGQRIPYDCKVCGKKFASKRGIARHNCITVL